MGNLVIFVGAAYAVALAVQIVCHVQSTKKGKASTEEAALEAGLMTPQNM